MAKRVIIAEKKIADILEVEQRTIRNNYEDCKISPGKYDLLELIKKFVEVNKSGEFGVLTGKRLGEILGVTDRAIRMLVDKNILIKTDGKFDLIKSVKSYIDYLNSNNQNQQYKEAQTKLLNQKYEERAKILHKAEDIENEVSRFIINIKTKLLAIPNKASKDLLDVNERHEITKILKEYIYTALDECANYQIKDDDGEEE